MLNELAKKYRNLKGSQYHNYMFEYERYMEPIQSTARDVLEIGVSTGTSMKMWRDYFPQATIHGVDIDPACTKYAEDRVRIYIGRQEDQSFMETVGLAATGGYDLVVDDGCHVCEHIVKTMEYLKLYLKKGAFYFIEDVGESSLPWLTAAISRGSYYIHDIFLGNKAEKLIIAKLK